MPSTKSGFTRHDGGMAIVAVLWGANFSANKFALTAFPPVAFAATRFILASVLLLAVVWWLAPGERIAPRVGARLAGLGIIGNTGYQAAFMSGLVTTSAINASLILASLPVVVAVLGAVLKVERTSAKLWFGILIATGGVVVVILARGVHLSAQSIRGDGLVLLACCCWSAFTVGVRRVGQGQNPLRVTALTTVAGTPGLVALSWSDLRALPWSTLSMAMWAAVIYSSVFAIALAYIIWSYAVQGIGGSRTALYNCVIPVVAALFAWFVLGERPVPTQAVGAALVFGGVVLATRS